MSLEGEKYDRLAGFAEYAAMGIIEEIHYWMIDQDVDDDIVTYHLDKVERLLGFSIPDEIVEAIRNGKDAHHKGTYQKVWALVADALDERVPDGDEPPVGLSFA